MILFVLLFLSIYAGMHGVVYWGSSPLLKGHPLLPAITLIWMGLMILAPVAVRILDHSGYPGVARPLAWVGFTWMGFVWLAFACFSLQALVQLLRLGIGIPAIPAHGPAAAMTILLIVGATGFYGIYEAHNLKTETIRLTTNKLPPGQTLRVVQVSDLHLGLIHQQEALAPIVERIRQLDPELLIATGDIVDAELSHLDGLSTLWNEITPRLGKYAVTGNHEVYAGLDQALDFLTRSGFIVLRQQEVQLTPHLALIGVDDPALSRQAEDAPLPEDMTVQGFTLLLKHRPTPPRDSFALFDLQLSGHAHRGQIFPFNLLTRLRYPLQDGLSKLPEGSYLYASRGTGTWGPPIRVGSPPELTLFEITGEETP